MVRVFTCNQNFEDMLTCIYDAWEWAISNGHENVRLELEPVLQTNFFSEYHHVAADPEKAKKVARSVRNKISMNAYFCVFYACLYEQDVLDLIYQYLRVGFKVGKKVDDMLTEQTVMRMMEIRRKVANEIHHFREFLRFDSWNNEVFVSHLEPRNDVIYQVATHFADRMPSERWMIIDDNRKYAVIHPVNEEMYIQRFTEEEMGHLQKSEEFQDEFIKLWKTFFDTIAIKERENRACQNNLMPIWMRKHVTEFTENSSYL